MLFVFLTCTLNNALSVWNTHALCVALKFSLTFTSVIFMCAYMYKQRSWENNYWHAACRRELLLFHYFSTPSINLQFIFNTGDVELWMCGSSTPREQICIDLLQQAISTDIGVIFL